MHAHFIWPCGERSSTSILSSCWAYALNSGGTAFADNLD